MEKLKIVPYEANAYTDAASVQHLEPVNKQVFFDYILEDNDNSNGSNHENVFHVDELNNNVGDLADDENEKIEELRELRVNTSFGRGVHNAIEPPGHPYCLLSSGSFFRLDLLRPIGQLHRRWSLPW